MTDRGKFIAIKGGVAAGMDEMPKPALSAEEARKLTDEFSRDVQRLWMRLLKLYEGGAHIALGYSSWDKYMENEFLIRKGQAYRMLRSARVVEFLGEVSPGDTTLQYEKHARELSRMLNTHQPEEMAEAWQEAQDQAASRGKPVTTQDVRRAVRKVTGTGKAETPARPALPKPKPKPRDLAEQSVEHLRQVDFLVDQFKFTRADASDRLAAAAQLNSETMIVYAAIGDAMCKEPEKVIRGWLPTSRTARVQVARRLGLGRR